MRDLVFFASVIRFANRLLKSNLINRKVLLNVILTIAASKSVSNEIKSYFCIDILIYYFPTRDSLLIILISPSVNQRFLLLSNNLQK